MTLSTENAASQEKIAIQSLIRALVTPQLELASAILDVEDSNRGLLLRLGLNQLLGQIGDNCIQVERSLRSYLEQNVRLRKA